jgi:hypothetical protein
VCKLCGKRISSINRLQALSQAVGHLVAHTTTDQQVREAIEKLVGTYFEMNETVVEL